MSFNKVKTLSLILTKVTLKFCHYFFY